MGLTITPSHQKLLARKARDITLSLGKMARLEEQDNQHGARAFWAEVAGSHEELERRDALGLLPVWYPEFAQRNLQACAEMEPP